MKKYHFALSAVLRARHAQEDMAKANLLRAHQAATRAAAAVAENRSHYAAASAAAAGAEFRAHRQLWSWAGEAVAAALSQQTQAQVEVTKETERYLAASQAVSVVEHLDEARRQEHAMAVQRDETADIDDLVTSRYVRRASATKRHGDAGNLGGAL